MSNALWWFACLALVGLAVAGYALGRLMEQRALAAQLHAARSQHAALLSALTDTVWRTNATHQLVADADPPQGAVATIASPLPWLGALPVQQALAARRPFFDLLVQASPNADRADTAISHTTGPTAPSTGGRAAAPDPAVWSLHGQPLLDEQGRFAGFVGTARAVPDSAGIAAAAPDAADSGTVLQAQAAAADERARAAGATQATQAAEAALAAARAESVEADSFSFTVSHDLRAPIRVVDGFTRIVKEDYGHLLDRVGNDHLDRVLNAAARMNQMIDALLTLARLSNQPLTRQPVNLSQIAHYVVDELQRAHPGREVDVSIEEGLQVVGDPTLLRLVLENLLGNAWKYSARMPQAQISLASVPHANGRAFVVRDNGAGFDMRAAERLFGVFQRLHSASEFAGHGVGLASARRIVRRHGGDIWAEAEPARGAAFSFTLSET
jgi:signal transduction histidine kinase